MHQLPSQTPPVAATSQPSLAVTLSNRGYQDGKRRRWREAGEGGVYEGWAHAELALNSPVMHRDTSRAFLQEEASAEGGR